jgi:hypothetical protein
MMGDHDGCVGMTLMIERKERCEANLHQQVHALLTCPPIFRTWFERAPAQSSDSLKRANERMRWILVEYESRAPITATHATIRDSMRRMQCTKQKRETTWNGRQRLIFVDEHKRKTSKMRTRPRCVRSAYFRPALSRTCTHTTHSTMVAASDPTNSMSLRHITSAKENRQMTAQTKIGSFANWDPKTSPRS